MISKYTQLAFLTITFLITIKDNLCMSAEIDIILGEDVDVSNKEKSFDVDLKDEVFKNDYLNQNPSDTGGFQRISRKESNLFSRKLRSVGERSPRRSSRSSFISEPLFLRSLKSPVGHFLRSLRSRSVNGMRALRAPTEKHFLRTLRSGNDYSRSYNPDSILENDMYSTNEDIRF